MPPQGSTILIRDITAIPVIPRGLVLEHVDILITETRLVAVEPAGSLAVPAGSRVIDGAGMLALPGLVNAHNHAGLALLKATSEALSLEPWLEWLLPRQRLMNDEDLYWSTLLSCLEQTRAGVTTFADMIYPERPCAEAIERAGLRAVVSESVMERDPGDDRPGEGLLRLERSLEFALAWRGRSAGRITTRLAPHSVYMLRPGLLGAFAEAATQHRLGLQIHCSETRAEVEGCLARHGCTPPALLNEVGCLDVPILLAHAVHLTDQDIELVDRPQVGLSHNPGSNLKLQSGLAPLPALVGRRLAVGLGTDSAASNDSQDILKELYLAAVLHRWPAGSEPAWQALELATIGGARALGLDDAVGSLEPGKRADLILLKIAGDPRHLPGRHLVRHLAYTGRGTDVYLTIVDGEILMEAGQFGRLDPEEIARECRGRAARLLAS
jgi:5-methylthioadenosine/S-adenosylhomocysteine deaminase